MNWEAFNSHLYQAMVLSDGMQMLPVHVTDDCSREGRGTKGICASISVDVNGEKAPNQIGRDVFIFALKETGLYPQGCDSDYCVGTEGYGCACKVLNEGAMNY